MKAPTCGQLCRNQAKAPSYHRYYSQSRHLWNRMFHVWHLSMLSMHNNSLYMGMSELCLGLFGWRLSVSEDVLIPNLLEKIYRSWQLIYGLVFQCPPIPENAYGRGCLDGVCGCQTVSGSYLGVSSRCLGEYRCQINHKELNRSRHIKLLPFLPVTSHGQMRWISLKSDIAWAGPFFAQKYMVF